MMTASESSGRWGRIARTTKIRLKPKLSAIIRPRHKLDFLNRLPRGFGLLDVGCGSNSPYIVKSYFPDCTYTGIDVGDYNQSKPNLSDHYVLVEPARFSEGISALGKRKFDAVISAHNLEHCNDRESTLRSMMSVLKDGGWMYLSFPCEESVGFPSRTGCLNFYDDPTHQSSPPDFSGTVEMLEKNRFEIEYATKRYRSIAFRTAGDDFRACVQDNQAANAWNLGTLRI